MKKNNISRKYDGAVLFGSILGSLFTLNQNVNRPKHDREIRNVSINQRRASLFG